MGAKWDQVGTKWDRVPIRWDQVGTKTQKYRFFNGFKRKNGGPSWDQVGPKSKNVDISLVLIGFLKYH